MLDYEGRIINKQQIDVILSIFSLRKIRNIRFVGNFIPSTSLEFYCDDVILTSFVSIKYDVIAIESFIEISQNVTNEIPYKTYISDFSMFVFRK